MKEMRLLFAMLLFLSAGLSQLPAQPSEADGKSLAETRAKAEAGDAKAQFDLGCIYANGDSGVTKDEVEAYKWWLLAADQGNGPAKERKSAAQTALTREEIAAAQKMAQDFKPTEAPAAAGDAGSAGITGTRSTSAGAGFLITNNGILYTNEQAWLKSFGETKPRKAGRAATLTTSNIVAVVFLVVLFGIVFPIWMIIQSAQRKQYGWLVVIFLTGIIGAVAYYFVGRNSKQP